VLHFTAIVPKDQGSSFSANRLGPIMRFDSKADFFNIMKSVKFMLAFWRYSTVSIKFSTKGSQMQFCSGKR
jgi:hypothetical protein